MFHWGSLASTGELCGEASKQVPLVQLLLPSLCHLEKDLGAGAPTAQQPLSPVGT